MSQFNNDMTAIIRCSQQFRSDKVAPYGIKYCHIGYLSRICYNPGISQDRLAQLLFVNKSNVARQVTALEEDGFITRSASATDKRVMELYPTEKATQLLPKLWDIVCQWDAIATEGLSEEEVATLSRILAKMKDNAAAWMESQ